MNDVFFITVIFSPEAKGDYLCLLLLKIICTILPFPSNFLSNLKSYTIHHNRIGLQLLSTPIVFGHFTLMQIKINIS